MNALPILRLAATAELALVLIENLIPSTHGMLPIGGSHMAQIAACFAISYVLLEVWSIIEELGAKRKD